MADREFVFSNPEIQALIKNSFIPLAMNDWYLRRQQDNVGVFYRKMTEASPRGQAGENTRQGRYVFTAAGKYLGFNNNRSPERILKMLNEALQAWEKLPAAERAPQEILSLGKPDDRYHREVPQGTAIVRVTTRALDQVAEGQFQTAAAAAAKSNPEAKEATADGNSLTPNGLRAARDYLWLQPQEIQELSTAIASGKETAISDRLAKRVLRFHLVDNTRGEPPSWQLGEAKLCQLSLVPEKGGSARLQGKLEAASADGSRGISAEITGHLAAEGGVLKELRVLAVGQHWGEGQHVKGARPGKQWLGHSLIFLPEPLPSDKIPPQFSHWLRGYWEAERN